MTVVFLCVGAAKAGTTWLYRQLSRHPECHFRSIKELHYFDALEYGRMGRHLKAHQETQVAHLAEAAERGVGDAKARKISDRGDWLDVIDGGAEDVPAYLEYLHAGAGKARVVGEMTPAYALLPESRLQRMAAMAPDVRMLFLLRDPVERLWSHVRMMAARRDETGQVTYQRCANLLRRTLNGKEEQIAMRSDYAGAIRRLVASLPSGMLLIEVFEEITRGEGLARVCDFLGISRMSGELQPAHAGQPLAMTPEQRLAATKWLRPQYDAAERALGRRPADWAWEG